MAQNHDVAPRTSKPREVDVDPDLLVTIASAGAPAHAPRPVRPNDRMPGTGSWVQSFRTIVQLLRHGVDYSTQMRVKYGDLYRVVAGGVPMVVVWDADEIHRILKNDEQLWSTALGWNMAIFDGLDPRGGNVGTLLSLDFDDHRAARRLVQPAFTLKAIEGYLAIAERDFARTIPRWIERGHVDFKREARTLLARVASEIFTGLEDPVEIARVDAALYDFWHGMMALVRSSLVSPTFRRARRGLDTLLRTFRALVPERRRAGGADLFSRMCVESDGQDDEAMVRVFITIMFGAFDTTSAGMTSMAYLLAKHPEWQERLRDEARATEGAPLDLAAMKTMKLHEWVWKETLRLMPVAGHVPRCTLCDTSVGGQAVAAGTLVMPMIGAVGRHPKWWRDPTKFDPERFGPERAEDRQHGGIFNPFGAGAHACVGMQLANFEMKMFWQRLLTSARFRLAPDYTARHTFMPLGIVSGDVRLSLEALPPLRNELRDVVPKP